MEMFMPCDMTQMFNTTNLGLTWEIIPFNEMVSHIHSKVQYTSDPNTLYSINTNFALDQTYPAKSTDGGATWTPITDPTNGESYYIFVDRHHTQRILLSSYSNLYFSSNGGVSWAQAYSNSDLYLGGVFWNGTEIYVGTRIGLLVSTNNGSSFSIANYSGYPSNSGVLSLTGAKTGNTIRLVATIRGSGDMWPAMQASEYWDNQEIYKIDVSEPSPAWTITSNGIPGADFPFFVDMADHCIDTIYSAGASGSTFHPSVYKSVDGGANWTMVFQTVNNQNIETGWMGDGGDLNWGWAENAMGFDVRDNDPNTIVISDWGFVHISDNGGSSWTQAYVDPTNAYQVGTPTQSKMNYASIGLENTSCWWMHWTSSDSIITGYSDITALKTQDGGDSWSFDYTGLNDNSVYHLIQHPTQAILYAATSTVHDIYQSTHLQDDDLDNGGGSILYSTDDGTSWQELHDFGHPVIWMAIDPNLPNTMYASIIHSSNGGIYKTTNLDQGISAGWNKLTAPVRTQGHPFNTQVLNNSDVVCTYSGKRDGGGSFTASSGVYLSTDGGTSWIDRSHAGMHYWTKDITIDPHDTSQSTWYVSVFDGWGGAANNLGGLYKTTNKGLNWTKIFDLDRVESCSIDPSNPDIMYITTEYEGLRYCDNLTDVIPTQSLVSSYRFQHPTRIFFNPFKQNEVWITSFGNGMNKSQNCPSTMMVSGILTESVYKSSSSLVTTPNVATQVLNMDMVTFISNTFELNPGFEVQNGAVFELKIGDCSSQN
jgi:hypothetical protein